MYISWNEHIIDDPEIAGFALSGSDGLVMADLDGDGFEDGHEVALSTDPLLASSVPSLPILGLELIGGDLTDPEDDGDPDIDEGYDAVFASSEEEEGQQSI